MRTVFAILVILALALGAFAAEVRTIVKHVSASTVYLDQGKKAGIAAGDTVTFMRGDSVLAILAVTFVADKSASCALPESGLTLSAGDSAVVNATGVLVDSASKSEYATADSATAYPEATPVRKEPSVKVNRLTGSVGMEYLVQDDREEFGYDYTQPSLNVRLRLSEIQESHVSASLRMRLRKTMRDRESSSATESQTSHRIYEAALRYENPDRPWEFGVGRMTARELRGIGFIDGGYAKYKLSPQFFAGAFAGTEPDLENTEFQTDVTKGGVFTAYDRKVGRTKRLTATLGLAGTYENGQIDREFIYQQVNYFYGSRFRAYESTEINVYRDWLKDKQDKSLDLASVLLNARYAFVDDAALSIGYDNRKSYYTYDSRSVPDSLFDDALRQGWRGSIDAKLTRTVAAEVGAGLRTTDGDSKNTKTGWASVRVADILKSGVRANAQVRTYSGEYSDGVQPSLSLSRSIVREVEATLQFGANSYTLNATNETFDQSWVRAVFDVSVARHIFGSLDLEAARGSGRNVNVVALGAGYRF